MSIGDYLISILDAAGRPSGAPPIRLRSRTGPPDLGHEILIEGSSYRVLRVQHEGDSDGEQGDASYLPHIYVAAVASPQHPPRPIDASRRGDRESHVIAFDAPAVEAGLRNGVSAMLPPALVAVIACVGYREQATRFRQRDRVAAQLLHDDLGWYIEDQRPEQLWALSRQAKQAFSALMLVIAAGPAMVPWNQPVDPARTAGRVRHLKIVGPE